MNGDAVKSTVEYRVIPRKQLKPLDFNPRKLFKPDALKKLAASIKEKGILEPLVVRPADGNTFQIVCGERRSKAAEIAGLSEIPCVIRHIGDVEALEIMVIENHQRADVHPLDEANAFALLLEKANTGRDKTKPAYDTEAIAAKVGMSISYVRERLQLRKLIKAAVDLFMNDSITVGHAVQLARLQDYSQKEALEFLMHEVWPSDRYDERVRVARSTRELRQWIEVNVQLELKHAQFDTKDPSLIAGTPACQVCPKRSGFNAELFHDITSKDICMDRACFKLKMAAAIEKRQAELREKVKDAKLVPISESSYLEDDEKIIDGLKTSNQYALVGNKHCKHEVTGLYIDGKNEGKEVKICLTKSCKKHHQRYQSYSSQPSPAAKAKQEKRKQEAANEKNARFLILQRIIAGTKTVKEPHLRILAASMLEHHMDYDAQGVLNDLLNGGEKRGLEKVVERIVKRGTAKELAGLLIAICGAAEVDVNSWNLKENKGAALEALAKLTRIDTKKIRKEVAAAKRVEEDDQEGGEGE